VDAPERVRSPESCPGTPVADAFDLVAGIPMVTPLPSDER
jgi:hypothetical protein